MSKKMQWRIIKNKHNGGCVNDFYIYIFQTTSPTFSHDRKILDKRNFNSGRSINPRANIATVPQSHYDCHLASGIPKSRDNICSVDAIWHTCRITRLMKILITETWNPGMRNGLMCALARPALALSFCLRDSLPVPLLRNRAITRRFHAERFPGRHP